HDAVLLRVLFGYDLHAQHARLLRLVDLRHLQQAGHLAANQIVSQVHEERLGANGRLRTQHGMPQSERRRLPDVNTGGIGRQHAAQLVEQVALALRLEHVLELLVGIEMILNRTLGSAGDEYQAPRAGRQGLLDGVLDERLVDHRKHLLGAGLGGGKEPRPAPGDRKHCGTNHRLLTHLVLLWARTPQSLPRERLSVMEVRPRDVRWRTSQTPQAPCRNCLRQGLRYASRERLPWAAGRSALLRGPRGTVSPVRPFEYRRPHAVPGAAFRAAPEPADAVHAAVIALIAPAGIPDARQQRPQGNGVRGR